MDYLYCWNALTAIATLVLAIVTYKTVREMRKSRLEDNKAYVYPLIKYDDVLGYAYIYNSGNKVAKNVRVEYSPSITPYLERHYNGINPFNNSLTLAPKSYDRIEILNKNKAWGREGCNMPTRFQITISYDQRESDNVTETFNIDINYDKYISNPPRKDAQGNNLPVYDAPLK